MKAKPKEGSLAGGSPLIHVVDDDPSVVLALKRLLRSWGMQVRTFSSGEAFLSAALDLPAADCVVLDIQMPGMTGLEVQARMNQAGSDIPIIFITGHETEGVEERALKAGAIGFLRKPFSDCTMVALIRRGTEERRKPAGQAVKQEQPITKERK